MYLVMSSSKIKKQKKARCKCKLLNKEHGTRHDEWIDKAHSIFMIPCSLFDIFLAIRITNANIEQGARNKE